jgi:LysR family transcriptional regulator, hca operon transcriptional activator
LELRHLRYFVAVAEAGSFTLAAERLHTVQPSLSRQIRDLEAHIGTPLFVRTTRTMQLTEAGKVFLDEARLVLAQADRAVERARRAAAARSEHLAIGFLPGVESQQLARITNWLQRQSEHIELAVRSRPSPVLIEDLHAQRLDAAFIRPSQQAQGLKLLTISREKLIVALPATHPLANNASISLAQLAEEALVDVTHEHAPVLYAAIKAFSEREGVVLRWAYASEDLLTALSLISTAGALCLLPENAASVFPPEVRGVALSGDTPTIALALAWHPENTSAPLLRLLQAFDETKL